MSASGPLGPLVFRLYSVYLNNQTMNSLPTNVVALQTVWTHIRPVGR